MKDTKKYIYIMIFILLTQFLIIYRQQTLMIQVENEKQSTIRVLKILENLWLK